LLAALLWMVAAVAPAEPREPARWPDERLAPPLMLHADFSLDEHLGVAHEAATLQRELHESLGIQPTRELVHVMLFQHKATYQDYLRLHFDDLPFRRAMFIKTDGPGMVFAFMNADLAEDVRHECTHALLHGALPMVPLWLDEGLAEYHELPTEKRAAGHSHLPRVRWLARLRGITPLEQLEQIESLERMRQADYRDAWAWVHFMLHGPPAAREVLRDYLAEIQSHQPPEPLSKRPRQRIPQLDQRVTDHFIQWKP
jgi:hypothetical protein